MTDTAIPISPTTTLKSGTVATSPCSHRRESQPIPLVTATTSPNLDHRPHPLYRRHLIHMYPPHLSPLSTTSPKATTSTLSEQPDKGASESRCVLPGEEATGSPASCAFRCVLPDCIVSQSVRSWPTDGVRICKLDPHRFKAFLRWTHLGLIQLFLSHVDWTRLEGIRKDFDLL